MVAVYPTNSIEKLRNEIARFRQGLITTKVIVLKYKRASKKIK